MKDLDGAADRLSRRRRSTPTSSPLSGRDEARLISPTPPFGVALRRFEACVADGDGTFVAPRGADAGRLREVIEDLCAAGFDMVVITSTTVDTVDGQLRARPAGPGRLILCVNRGSEIFECVHAGPSLLLRREGTPDKTEAARWAFADLWAHGIAPADVIVVGDEFGTLPGAPGLPAGRDRIHAVLDDQRRRRRQGDPPVLSPAAEWSVAVDGLDERNERARASVLTVADGVIGTIGAPLLSHPSVRAETLAAGVYEGEGSAEHLRPYAAWNQLSAPLEATARLSRVLDVRAGVLAQQIEQDGQRASSVGFSSLADPGTAVLWAAGEPTLLGPSEPRRSESEIDTSENGPLAIHVSDVRGDDGRGSAILQRIAVYVPGDAGLARSRADDARARGVTAAYRAHREAWAARWADADIEISGDEELQRNVRFSLFQLMSAVATSGEAALGARGLSGDGYNGHVFWDSDVFVIPFLAATCPAAARAMLEYRVRRIGPAMEQARRLGRDGAKFPWESASTGREITPTMVTGPRGENVVVRTGEMEEHIVADVAWAACRYVDWTGDDEFRRGPLVQLLVETARYWASRIDSDSDGSMHIRHVIGPDEYHDDVDDNAFTNVLARWNLRAAVRRAGSHCDDHEVQRWSRLADRLVDGYDPHSLVYEQFAGFSSLTPFPLRETYGPGPLAADSLIGFDRIQSLQVLKQADALMLHLMVPDEVEPGSLLPNLDQYLPITAHGSSLSPAVHAALLARAWRHPEALDLLHFAAGIDVDNASPTTAHGLHTATMGGVWLAMAEGFAGIQPNGDGLTVNPRLPDAWQDLTVRVVYRGVRVKVRIDHHGAQVETDRPLDVKVTQG